MQPAVTESSGETEHVVAKVPPIPCGLSDDNNSQVDDDTSDVHSTSGESLTANRFIISAK